MKAAVVMVSVCAAAFLAAGCEDESGAAQHLDLRDRPDDVALDSLAADGATDLEAPDTHTPSDVDTAPLDVPAADLAAEVVPHDLSVPSDTLVADAHDAADLGPPPDADLFVAPDGAGDLCTYDQPCALGVARGKVRALNDTMASDLLVLLRGGRYPLTQTLTFGAEDSGLNGHFVVYEAFPGERPVLSGGVALGAWTLHDAGRGIYRTPAPAGLQTRQLFVDGRRARRARSAIEPGGFTVVTDGYQGPVAMDTWGNKTDIELVDAMQWKAFRCAVQSISGGHIVMKQPCWSLAQWHTNLGMEAPTWVENAYELLDSPGEWYHDRSAGQLHYLPRAGENLASAEVIASSLQTIVQLEGAHHLVFRGLSFSHSTWLRPGQNEGYPVLQAGQLLSGPLANQPQLESTPGAVVVHHSTDLIFERNRFEHLGAVGLSFTGASRRCQVGGNLFRDLSAGAVAIGNVNGANWADAQTCANVNILNNVIADVGLEYLDSPAILLTYAKACSIQNNEVHNVPYTGVSLGWGWGMQSSALADNVIVANRISNAMLRLNDGGLIYTLNTQPGARIADNLLFGQVHDYGGIYLDQGSQHFDIGGNVVASTPRWTFLQPEVPPRAQGNSVHDNWSDTSELGCCGSQGCCTDVNTLTNNATFSSQNLPAAVQTIATATGIDPYYASMRPAAQRFEAEAYLHGGNGVGFNENPSWLGADNDYRDDRVDVEACEACSNDHRVGGIASGEWLAYYLYVPAAGTYELAFWVVGSSGGTVSVTVDGQSRGSASIAASTANEPVEGGHLSDVSLSEGLHRVQLGLGGSFGFDYFELRL